MRPNQKGRRRALVQAWPACFVLLMVSCHKESGPPPPPTPRDGPLLNSLMTSGTVNGYPSDTTFLELFWDAARRPILERSRSAFTGYGPDKEISYNGNMAYATFSPDNRHSLLDTFEMTSDGIALRRSTHTVDSYVEGKGKGNHFLKYYYDGNGFLEKTVMIAVDSGFGGMAALVAMRDTLTISYEWQGGNIRRTTSLEQLHKAYYKTDTPFQQSQTVTTIVKDYTFASQFPAPPSNTNPYFYNYLPEIGNVVDPRHSTLLPDKAAVVMTIIPSSGPLLADNYTETYQYTYTADGLIINAVYDLGPTRHMNYAFTYTP
jgi:hypothetical protein